MKHWAFGYVYMCIPVLYPTWGNVCLKITREKKILLLTESGFDDNRKQIEAKECRTWNCQMKLKINQEEWYSSCVLFLPLILISKH